MRKRFLTSLLGVALLAGACTSSNLPTGPAAAPTPTPPPAPQTARYRVTFDQTWSAATHAVPANPHFSGLIGGTHDARARFWQPGGLASEGIRLMAERGRQSPLDLEVDAARQAGTAEHVLAGGRPPSGSPATDQLEFQISQRYPLVTLVSMVAPSPDWFVGVDSLPLFENGQWVEERTVLLVPWDAGTDSGRDFDSRDRATSPPEPIMRIGSPPLGASGAAAPMGAFRFTRLR
jgi:hypothetical protein